jgi:NADH:ubiquinone oxidoreductase subunit C
MLHIKLSSMFYSTQLVDIFAYENLKNNYPQNAATSPLLETKNKLNSKPTQTIVYNLHNLLTNNRFFVFTNLSNTLNIKKKKNLNNLKSITELYPNA